MNYEILRRIKLNRNNKMNHLSQNFPCRVRSTLKFLLGTILSIGCAASALAQPALIVDDDGPADFNSIQAAIDAAYSGATIVVNPGLYVENVVIDKSIHLKGAGADRTTVDGGRFDDPWVTKRVFLHS